MFDVDCISKMDRRSIETSLSCNSTGRVWTGPRSPDSPAQQGGAAAARQLPYHAECVPGAPASAADDELLGAESFSVSPSMSLPPAQIGNHFPVNILQVAQATTASHQCNAISSPQHEPTPQNPRHHAAALLASCLPAIFGGCSPGVH